MPNKIKINSDVCRRFADIRKQINLNKKKFADSIGIDQSVAGDIELDYREPSREVLLKLASVYGININWLLTGEGEMFLSSVPNEGYKVPLLSQKVSCGEGTDWLDESNVKDYIDILSLFPRSMTGRIYAFTAQGNSMIGAGIKNGDYVLFHAGENQRPVDDIYVFALDGEVLCKQLEFDSVSKKIKIYSLRVAELEKADLLKTLSTENENFNNRFHLFGRVFCWLHPNHNE